MPQVLPYVRNTGSISVGDFVKISINGSSQVRFITGQVPGQGFIPSNGLNVDRYVLGAGITDVNYNSVDVLLLDFTRGDARRAIFPSQALRWATGTLNSSGAITAWNVRSSALTVLDNAVYTLIDATKQYYSPNAGTRRYYVTNNLDSTCYVTTGPDGTWQEITRTGSGNHTAPIRDVYWSGSEFFACSHTGNFSDARINLYRSTDGLNFTGLPMPAWPSYYLPDKIGGIPSGYIITTTCVQLRQTQVETRLPISYTTSNFSTYTRLDNVGGQQGNGQDTAGWCNKIGYANNINFVCGTGGTLQYQSPGQSVWLNVNHKLGNANIFDIRYINSVYYVISDVGYSYGSTLTNFTPIVGIQNNWLASQYKDYYSIVFGNSRLFQFVSDRSNWHNNNFNISITNFGSSTFQPESIPAQLYTFSNIYKQETIAGNVYLPLGGLTSIDSIQRDLKTTSYDLAIGISGVQQENIFNVLNYDVRGADVQIYRGFYDQTGNLLPTVNSGGFPIPNPNLRYSGTITGYVIEENRDPIDPRQGLYNIQLKCSNYKYILENNSSARKTNQSSWQDPFYGYATDTSMNSVANLVNVNFDFGKGYR